MNSSGTCSTFVQELPLQKVEGPSSSDPAMSVTDEAVDSTIESSGQSEAKADLPVEDIQANSTLEEGQADSLIENAQAVDPSVRDAQEVEPKQESKPVSKSNSRDLPLCLLPGIRLPKFSGDKLRWLVFKSMYTSLIHDEQYLKEIEKFCLLKQCLEGSALQTIEWITYSGDDSYQLAWKTLCDWYDNKKFLIDAHMRALFETPTLTQESSKELYNLIYTVSGHLGALRSLDLPTEHWDMLVMHIVCKKLDPTTCRNWLEHYYLHKDMLTFKDMREFLQERARILELLEMRPDHPNHNTLTCLLCDQHHYIYNCGEFRAMSVTERIRKVRQLKLCMNCLKEDHKAKDCQSSACRHCNRKHNSLLHKEEELAIVF